MSSLQWVLIGIAIGVAVTSIGWILYIWQWALEDMFNGKGEG